MKVRTLAVLSLAVGLLPLLGCGGSSTPAAVQGKVTLDGAPVTGGSISFHSATGDYTGPIAADGTYSIGDIPAGEMTVTVETESINPDKKAPPVYGSRTAGGGTPGGGGGSPKPGSGGGPPMGAAKGPDGKPYQAEGSPKPEGAPVAEKGTYVKIDAKYNDKDKSGIKKTLNAGKQTIDIELTK